MMKRFFRRGMLSLFALAAIPSSAIAQADFYKGKTVSLVISSGTGGGYDALGRLIAQYLPKHIPGNPTVVVKNMPGAGGLVGANFLYNAAPKDGLTIGGIQNVIPFDPLFGGNEAKFDATKFIWLGTPNRETSLLVVTRETPVDNWEQTKTKEITVGSGGQDSLQSFFARLVNEMLGTKMKIIVGYQSQNEAFLAMERGELNGYPSVFYNSLMSSKPTWLKEGKIKILMQMGYEKEPEVGNVPSLLDLVKSEEDKRVVEAALAPLAVGRPYLLPPGVPEDRVAIMSKAFADLFADPEFVAEGNKRGMDVSTPRDGKALHDLIEGIYKNTPPAIVARIKKLQAG
jgi:tripartite-type tricarboxylate transporter receptor subunit TctC